MRRMLVLLAIVLATVGPPPRASAGNVAYSWHTVPGNDVYDLSGWFEVRGSALAAGFIGASDITDFYFVTTDLANSTVISVYTPLNSVASTSRGGKPDPGTGVIPIDPSTGFFTVPGGMGPPGTETLAPYLAITADDSSSSIKITTTAVSMESSGSGRWTGYGDDPSHNHGFWTTSVPEPSSIVQVVTAVPMGLGAFWWRRRRASRTL